MAKTASHNDYHWIHGNLDHLTYTGQHDLYAASQESPYVPKHAKGLLAPIPTLVLQQPPAQPVGTSLAGQLQSCAIKKKAPGVQLHSCAIKKKAIGVPPKTKLHPPSSPSHAKQIALPGPKIPLVAHVWRKHLAKSLHQSVGPLTPMQYGQLTSLRNKVGEAVLPLIEYVIDNWEIFANKAISQAGHLVAPSIPNISFLLKHHNIALQLAYASAIQKKLKNSNDLKLIQAFPAL